MVQTNITYQYEHTSGHDINQLNQPIHVLAGRHQSLKHQDLVIFKHISFQSAHYLRAEIIKTFKTHLHYRPTRGITPKRVTSGGIHLRDLAPGQHSSEESPLRWRTDGAKARFDRPGNQTPDLLHRLFKSKQYVNSEKNWDPYFTQIGHTRVVEQSVQINQ